MGVTRRWKLVLVAGALALTATVSGIFTVLGIAPIGRAVDGQVELTAKGGRGGLACQVKLARGERLESLFVDPRACRELVPGDRISKPKWSLALQTPRGPVRAYSPVYVVLALAPSLALLGLTVWLLWLARRRA